MWVSRLMKRQTALLNVPFTVDPGSEYTVCSVENSIKDFVHSSICDQLEQCCRRCSSSSSSLHYVRVSQSYAYTYGRDTASHDRVAMKLKLGYIHFREYRKRYHVMEHDSDYDPAPRWTFKNIFRVEGI
ncbi:hypothetical protein E2C01_065685 [Portunus trituberculatus]|uniref:Uncharacterized protein n=1 Tax=Portunus trituberculatus TaxID=210409 RepID=A0A5B7HRT3_PORTR|nr:hypothetical protein [Portunus trituberculatus]